MFAFIPEIEELVVNWHVTEPCNFKCKFCYSSWEKPGAQIEIWRNEAQTRHLLEALYRFLGPSNHLNPLQSNLRWDSLRLSLAGGEPTLLGGRLIDIATYASKLGFNISLITNGSRPDTIADVVPYLDMLGLSVDSINPVTNDIIGRADRKGRQVSPDDMVDVVRRARAINPRIEIKINTVVNAANANEDLSELILKVRPDRWKVMQMLPSTTDALSVDAQTFQSFVDRHSAFRSTMTVEGIDDMTRSYIMVDPHGRFFQNQQGLKGYRYSRPILEIGADKAFKEIEFCPDKFVARYRFN